MANNRFVTTIKRDKKPTGPKANLSVIILCAGIGYRMKSYGAKALLKFSDGSRVIDRIIESVELTYNCPEVIVTTGFESDKIASYLPKNIHIVENQLYESTNTVEELRLGLNVATNDNVLLIHGDLIFDTELLKSIPKGQSCIVCDENNTLPDDDIGVTSYSNIATILAYDLPVKWGYISQFDEKDVELLKKVISDRSKSKCFVFEVINEMIDKGSKFKTIVNKKSEILKVDSAKGWKEIK